MVNLTIFSQILQHIDRNIFNKAVTKYQTDKHNKGINSWTHLVSMIFCHFAKAQSLREITNGLQSITGNLNHLGIQGKCPKKSSLSYINEHRNWQMFREFYFMLLTELQTKGHFKREKFNKIKKKIYLLDSTIISVCIKIFDWAKYQKEKGAIKLHTLLDYDGCLPTYLHMSEGRQSDVKHAKYLLLPPKSVIVMDRGYLDFKMFYDWNEGKVTFVTRIKKSIKYKTITERLLPEGKDEHILKDEVIELTEPDTWKNYPEKMRLVHVYDEKNKKILVILTNNFSWTASTIAELYKQRWRIEIFFKELKQHLKIKSFIGTNENAMRIQIWTALITLLLLKYLKELTTYPWAMSNLIAFLRMNLFVKISLMDWLTKPFKPPDEVNSNEQLNLFAT